MPLDAGSLFPAMAAMPVGAMSGYWGQQRQDAALADNTLNQQGQQIQNAQQQNLLSNALADNPNIAAKRVLTGSDISTQQQGYDSGQVGAVQSAALNQKAQESITKMDTDKLSDTLLKHQAYVAADNIVSDPGFNPLDPNTHDALNAIFKNAGMNKVPDQFGPAEIATIHSLGQAAVQTIPFIQQTQMNNQSFTHNVAIENIKGQYGIEMARETGQASLLRSIMGMPQSSQILTQIKMAIPQQGGTITPDQVDQVKSAMAAALQQGEGAKFVNENYNQTLTSLRAESLSELQKQAKTVGIDPGGMSQQSLAQTIALKQREQQFKSLIDNEYQQQFGSIPIRQSAGPQGNNLQNSPNPASRMAAGIAQPVGGTQTPGAPVAPATAPPGAAAPAEPGIMDTIKAGLARMGAAMQPGAPGQPQAAPTQAPSGPAVGSVSKGYQFVGGDPSDPKSWKKQ